MSRNVSIGRKLDDSTDDEDEIDVIQKIKKKYKSTKASKRTRLYRAPIPPQEKKKRMEDAMKSARVVYQLIQKSTHIAKVRETVVSVSDKKSNWFYPKKPSNKSTAGRNRSKSKRTDSNHMIRRSEGIPVSYSPPAVVSKSPVQEPLNLSINSNVSVQNFSSYGVSVPQPGSDGNLLSQVQYSLKATNPSCISDAVASQNASRCHLIKDNCNSDEGSSIDEICQLSQESESFSIRNERLCDVLSTDLRSGWKDLTSQLNYPISPTATTRKRSTFNNIYRGTLAKRINQLRQGIGLVEFKESIKKSNKLNSKVHDVNPGRKILFLSPEQRELRAERTVLRKANLDKDFIKLRVLQSQKSNPREDVIRRSEIRRFVEAKRISDWLVIIKTIYSCTAMLQSQRKIPESPVVTSSGWNTAKALTLLTGGMSLFRNKQRVVTAPAEVAANKIKTRLRWGCLRIVMKLYGTLCVKRGAVRFITYLLLAWTDVQPIKVTLVCFHRMVRNCQRLVRCWLFSHTVRKAWVKRAWIQVEDKIIKQQHRREEQLLRIPSGLLGRDDVLVKQNLQKQNCTFPAPPFGGAGNVNLAHWGIPATAKAARVCPKLRNKFISSALLTQSRLHGARLEAYFSARNRGGSPPPRPPYRKMNLPPDMVRNMVHSARKEHVSNVEKLALVLLNQCASSSPLTFLSYFTNTITDAWVLNDVLHSYKLFQPNRIDDPPAVFDWVAKFVMRNQKKLKILTP